MNASAPFPISEHCNPQCMKSHGGQRGRVRSHAATDFHFGGRSRTGPMRENPFVEAGGKVKGCTL
jgi:hypothetical protein